ncbi:hypothetical protein AAMO2058_000257500 [Amorphochlora amoebiformis]|uniref:Uncharacterized protein n=1 Tax=Amorphochlora amoebiformis TaxID=1561963 RepID=A0A6T6TPF1_9EUKA|mmetsp:Transcript_19402/g.30825  ORF Transcript_19402/g.30825 Transcript_19402/m.30825 type:complete len:109 (+) Transcript_19402:75-401(+)
MDRVKVRAFSLSLQSLSHNLRSLPAFLAFSSVSHISRSRCIQSRIYFTISSYLLALSAVTISPDTSFTSQAGDKRGASMRKRLVNQCLGSTGTCYQAFSMFNTTFHSE